MKHSGIRTQLASIIGVFAFSLISRAETPGGLVEGSPSYFRMISGLALARENGGLREVLVWEDLRLCGANTTEDPKSTMSLFSSDPCIDPGSRLLVTVENGQGAREVIWFGVAAHRITYPGLTSTFDAEIAAREGQTVIIVLDAFPSKFTLRIIDLDLNAEPLGKLADGSANLVWDQSLREQGARYTVWNEVSCFRSELNVMAVGRSFLIAVSDPDFACPPAFVRVTSRTDTSQWERVDFAQKSRGELE